MCITIQFYKNTLYSFCLRNKNEAVNVTMEDTKAASVLLIRKLFLLMQNLEALPNPVYLSMKLYYNDDGKTNIQVNTFALPCFHNMLRFIVLSLQKFIGEV